MAEDWIKMRTDLYRDPKVCAIADILMSDKSQLARYVSQHCQRDMTVTRNVMRNVTVGALVSVWGVMRLRGKRENLDLWCRSVTLAVIDDIADIPGFGEAMSFVGWAEEAEDGVIFPRFFQDYNVDPEGIPGTRGDSSSPGATRQRRYRERQKMADMFSESVTGDVTCNVTSDITNNVTRDVTSVTREEKRREEKTHNAFALPDWVPADAWKDFEQMRVKRRKGLTDRARTLAVNELEKLRNAGHDPRAVIEQSVLRCWDSFYELKSPSRMNGHGGSDSIFG
jgi:hypothetical protein